jgi:hypothetical protein
MVSLPVGIPDVGYGGTSDPVIAVAPEIATSGSVVPPGSRDHAMQHPVTRLQNNIKEPKVYTVGTIRYAFFTTTREPDTTEEALAHDQWRQAMSMKYEETHQHR